MPVSSVPSWAAMGREVCCPKCGRPLHGPGVDAGGQTFHRECFTCDKCFEPIAGTYFMDKVHGLCCERCNDLHAPNCSRCGQKVRGKSVSAEGKTYHKECFTCKVCKRSIEGQYSLDKDDLSCYSCLQSRAPSCVGCGRKVIGECVTAEGRSFHPECFRCSMCHTRISGSYFQDKDTSSGKLFCQGCYEVKNPPKKCGYCKRRVDSDGVVVGSETFHRQCFSCCSCRQPIQGQFVKVKAGYLCTGCQPRCEGCKKPVAGSATVEVNGRQYHQACFKCSTCDLSIEGGYYEADWGLFRCQACHAGSLQAQEDVKESRHIAAERRLTRRNTAEFNLTWRPELTPCSQQALQTLGVPKHEVPRSKFVGLYFDKKTGRVACAALGSNCDRGAAINISYLASSLQILKRFGREPCFSLDPKDPHDLSGDTLLKRFYPNWLACTVVGEIMFQADYALKEICFGEHAEALPWLHNIFDEIGKSLENETEGHAARQWFTLRRPGVYITADGAVVPKVAIGVETRRLVKGRNGYEDAPYTDPNDPMVKQSAAISARFNEVASHLPVVGELLAVSRAMVAARFLLEHGCRCDNSVLERYVAPQTPEGPNYAMEIPTLSKRRAMSNIVPDNDGKGLVLQRRQRAMHGGVDLSVPAKKVPSKSDSARVFAPNQRPTLLPLFVQPPAACAA